MEVNNLLSTVSKFQEIKIHEQQKMKLMSVHIKLCFLFYLDMLNSILTPFLHYKNQP